MIAWLQHLTFSQASAIVLGMLAGFCIGGIMGSRQPDPEYPVCSPRVTRAWLKAMHRTSRKD
jgi:hypothetical protein